ncbi:MAG: hypothetical protein FJX74_22225, partial [Armatimonadetes bacterium]|nr:hypothetical protein [Armatimonadota bacterium]
MNGSILALSLLTGAAAFASQAYAPPPSGEAWTVTKVYLKPSNGSGPQGVVAFLCNDAEGQHRVQVFAKGLQPDTAYSVWFLGAAGEQPRRLGTGLRAPRSNAQGELRVVAATWQCEARRHE